MSERLLDTLNLYFDEFRLGDRFITASRVVTDADVREFAELTGDFNPLHIDDKFASSTRFGQRVVHGMLTLSITGGLRFPLNGDRLICLYGIDGIRMTQPVAVGETLRLEGEVTNLSPRDAGGVVTFAERVLNGQNEPAAVFERSALYRRSPS